MSTVLANPAEMIRQGAPHLIHSDEELAEYTEALFALTAKKIHLLTKKRPSSC
jgi:HTH-type transcriptional regulator / antitoxin HigA